MPSFMHGESSQFADEVCLVVALIIRDVFNREVGNLVPGRDLANGGRFHIFTERFVPLVQDIEA